jgi:hypothetical protein
MGNSRGSYRTTPRLGMAAFDKLPPSAREALHYAAFNWATQPVLTRHKRGVKGYRTGRDIAARFAAADRDKHEKTAKRDGVPLVARKASLKLDRHASRST